MLRFHLDESVNLAIAEGLRLRGMDCTTTPEVDLPSPPCPPAFSSIQCATGIGLRGHYITQDMGNTGVVPYFPSFNEKSVCGRYNAKDC